VTSSVIHASSADLVSPPSLDADPAPLGDVPGGLLDRLSLPEVLARMTELRGWAAMSGPERKRARVGASLVLEWLLTHPGDGWQQRWQSANPADGLDWIAVITADDPRTSLTSRAVVLQGLTCLMLARLFLPSHRFLRTYQARTLYSKVRETFRPDLFAQVERNAAGLGLRHVQQGLAMAALSSMVLHSGRDLDQLVLDDFLDFRNARSPAGQKPQPGVTVAWDLVRGIAQIPDKPLQTVRLRGQLATTELVDTYPIICRPIRAVLVRYLDERRPCLDYSSFANLARMLASFWADIEAHNPGIDSLHLSEQAAQAWRARVRVVVEPDGTVRTRLSCLNIFIPVRALYLDITQWALEDASWVPWAARCPVRRSDTAGYMKNKKQVAARMHQRIRDRLPHLLTLADSAAAHHIDQAALLATATATMPGESFIHADQSYTVSIPASRSTGPVRSGSEPSVLVEVSATGELLNLSRSEDEAFWAWAVIETLRHTGVRVEELLELTHLALVTYRLPDTGETIPLLQIVPSKSNEERLLLVTPELASVLASVVTRLRDGNEGAVAPVPRWDHHERIWSAPLPHLFQRRRDHRRYVINAGTVNHLLRTAWARTGIRDASGELLNVTAHDFRRMFVTDAVTGGLPIHIAAKLLGHASVTTTQAYHAVFQDELIRSYRAFLDTRRAARPIEEYREPTAAEWTEFQQHFHNRKLELGDCGRPYATPCSHEHACIRCPMLRVDPRARGRLAEIISNLRDRIDEANANGWRGEAQGLQTSLTAAAVKLAGLDRNLRAAAPLGVVNLGMPTEPSGPARRRPA
jgi:site-specific recombinase XerD